MARREEVGIELVAKDMASREVGRVGSALGGLGGEAERTGGRFGLLGSVARGVFNGVFIGIGLHAISLLGRAIRGMGDLIIGQNARLEQTEIAFTTLLGSAEAAQQFIADLQRFSATTPFDFPGVANAARLFMAMGFEASEVIPNLTAVGDAVAALGGGSAEVNRVVMALGQMRAAGRVNAQDMMQLTSIGIPAWQMLADHLGVTVAEARKLSEQGLIPAEEGLRAILEGIENSNMGGAMAAQARTFNGAMETIKDNVGLAISGAFKPLFDLVSQGVVAFADFTQTAEFQAWADAVQSGMAGVIDLFRTLFGGELSLDAVRDFVAGIGSELATLPGEIRMWLTEAATGFIDWIAPHIPVVLDQLSTLGQEIFNWLLTNAPLMAEQFMAWGSFLVDWITARIPDVVASLGVWAQSIFDWIVNEGVPRAAEALGPMILAFVDWVFEVLPLLLDNLDLIIGAIVGFIVTNAPVLIGKLVEWGAAFVGWIATEVIPRLIQNLPTILRVLLLWIGGAALKLFGKAAEMGAGFVGRLIGWIAQLPGRFGEWIGNLLGRFGGWIGSLVGKAVDMGRRFVSSVIDRVMTLPRRVGEWITNLIGRFGSWAASVGRGALDMGKRFVGDFIGGLASLPGKLMDKVRSAFAGINFSIGPFHVSASGIRIDLPKIDLPGFATGAWKIPNDMVAMVHKGEMVIPADIAARLRGERAGGLPTASPAFLPAGASGGAVTVTIVQHFGPSSVRSREDIRDIGRETAERARLLGLGLTGARVGGIG